MAEKIGKFFTFNQVTRVLEFATSNDKKSLGEENGMVKKRENVEQRSLACGFHGFLQLRDLNQIEKLNLLRKN